MVKGCDHKLQGSLKLRRKFFLESMLLIHPKIPSVVDFNCFDT